MAISAVFLCALTRAAGYGGLPMYGCKGGGRCDAAWHFAATIGIQQRW